MTCRPLLWIAAAAVSVGAVASTSSIAGADPAPGWNVTIDEPATEVVTSKHLTIQGTAARDVLIPIDQPSSVSVTVVPQGLPEACGPQFAGDAQVDEERRYTIDLDVRCNGPHEIQVVAHAGLSSSGGASTRDIGVAEPAATPDYPGLVETAEGGMTASWAPSSDLDAAGSVLRVGVREITFAPGVTQVVLPPADRNAAVSVRMLRWGAGGPGTTTSSEYSYEFALVHENPNTPNNTDPPPSGPPSTLPASTVPPTTPPGPSSTAPRGTGGSSIPTRGTGATSTTLPSGYSEELPFGAPDDAFVPGAETDRRPSSDSEERAVSTAAPVGGFVHTSEKRSPGLVAPFALGLLMITIAAHIAWYLRRSRPTPGGQVRLP